jgi:hypothetical protein
VVKSGVKIIGTSGAASTILDAAAATPRVRVFECHGNSNITLIEGFTITNGMVAPASADGSNTEGGALLADNNDGTKISRNIFVGNTAYGGLGQSSGITAGSQTYGGAIASLNSPNVIVNNVFRGNLAHGGNGGVASPAGIGGGAEGGAIWATGAVTVINNTFYNNSAIGGNGAANNGAGSGGSGGSANIGAVSAFSGTATNNIFANNTATGGSGGAAGSGGGQGANGSSATGAVTATSISYNLYYQNVPDDAFTGTNSIVAQDPKFVSVTDQHIQVTSPAKGTGTATGAPTIDLAGTTRPNPPSRGAYEAQVGLRHKDFNADGYSDLVWRNSSTGASAVWLMNGAIPGNGSGLTNLQFQNNAFSCVGVGDFDANGKADIVWRNNTTGQTIMWLMNGVNAVAGSGEFANVPAPWQIVGIGDFNGDGKSDLLWRNMGTGQNAIWLLDTLNVLGGSGEITQIADQNWHVGGVGDFNADGRSDILWRNDVTGVSAMWMMNGTTLLGDSGLTNLQLGSSYRAAAVGDFDGDGYSDVMWRNISTGANIIWLQHGTVTQPGSGAIGTVPDVNWNVSAVGDYNADGKDDIVWRNDTTGDTSIWMLNGANFAPGSGILGTTPPPWTIPQPR